MARYKYLGADPCQLVDGEFFIDLEPGQEFDAPEAFAPQPNPHPLYQPVTQAKPAPATAPQE